MHAPLVVSMTSTLVLLSKCQLIHLTFETSNISNNPIITAPIHSNDSANSQRSACPFYQNQNTNYNGAALTAQTPPGHLCGHHAQSRLCGVVACPNHILLNHIQSCSQHSSRLCPHKARRCDSGKLDPPLLNLDASVRVPMVIHRL